LMENAVSGKKTAAFEQISGNEQLERKLDY
jgi:hypothetical protein